MIRAGHRYPDLLGYTLAQFHAFHAAVVFEERQHLAALLAVSAVAAQGDRQAVTQLHRDLQRED